MEKKRISDQMISILLHDLKKELKRIKRKVGLTLDQV